MPTYEYRCHSCDERFDVVQSFADDALRKCPPASSGSSPAGCVSPGKGQVKKVFSAPAITFKGDGFYKTDSRAAKSGSGGGAGAGAGGKGGSGSGSEGSGSGDSDSASPDSASSNSSSGSGSGDSGTASDSKSSGSDKSSKSAKPSKSAAATN